MKRFMVGVAALVSASAVFGSSVAGQGAADRHFSARLTAAAEVPAPATPTTAHGTAQFHVSGDGSTVHYTVVVSQLSAPVVAAHVHRAPVGAAGPVVVPLFPVPDVRVNNGVTVFSGSFPMAAYPAFVADANAGLLYVNVHTPANPPGETRGQIG